jgi:hypothetical protein
MGRRRRSSSTTCRREAREDFSKKRRDSIAKPRVAGSAIAMFPSGVSGANR